MTRKTTIVAVALLRIAGGAAIAIKSPTLFSKPASATRERRLAEFEARSTPSEESARTSGGKRVIPSDTDAALIAKYGESRTKLARYTLITLLEINEMGISLMTNGIAMMKPGEMEWEMQAKEFAPVIETLKLTPEQLKELGRLI